MKFGKSGGGGRRCAKRTSAPLNALVRSVAETRCFELVDLSVSGARLGGPDAPRYGQEVLVTVEKVRAYGTVVWSDSGQFGVEFDAPLEPMLVNEIKLMVARAAGMPPNFKAAMDDWAMGMAR